MDIIKPYLKMIAAVFVAAVMFHIAGVKAQIPVTPPEPAQAVPGAVASPAHAPAAATAAVAQTVSSTYQLMPYDVIEVTVYQEEDLHKIVKLGADGTALLPLIGSVHLGGKTVSDAINLVRDRYAAGFVRNPDVLITVQSFRPKTFKVMGMVARPGIYTFEEGQHIDILDAVLMGGGFTRSAVQGDVLVKRVVNGKLVTLHVDAAAAAKDENVVPFEIQPGDSVYVRESMF